MAISTTSNAAVSTRGKFMKKHPGKLALVYFSGLLLPYLISRTLYMDSKGTYVAVISTFNLLAMMAFFIQFPLGSRLKQFNIFSNIDWNMNQHKKVGQWLGMFFLLHPLLILAPRFLVSFDDAWVSVVEVITSPQTLTGVIAWCLMIVWVLTAVYKNRLSIRYEIWRLTHLVGFVGIAILATLHVTSVGSHGQYQSWFNLVWWVLSLASILIVGFNYLIKPAVLKSKPFRLTHISKISSSDWLLTIESQRDDNFSFEAGQFAWLNTSGSTNALNEHPFSIASTKKDLPAISFIIRELGDYTSSLGTLRKGQDVYIDGPHGSLGLEESSANEGITLIAGGAGIGPMLSLLRELADRNETRPVRLIYGNGQLDQMVCQDEIQALESRMKDFRQQLVCDEETGRDDVHTGLIDKACLERSIGHGLHDNWALYLCGPEAMKSAVSKQARALNIPGAHLHIVQIAL